MYNYQTIVKEIPENFIEDDSIFHYTKMETGLKILHSMKLWMSPRKKSKDPIENVNDNPIQTWWSGSEEGLSEKIENRTKIQSERIINNLNKKLNHSNQVCFCCNSIEQDNQFGFLKPRMWNQYGDDFTGVCLVFSKTNILEYNSTHFHSMVNYIDFEDMEFLKLHIDRNKLDSDIDKKYERELNSQINEKLISKHKDYIGENEFRICSFSGENIDELDISGSIIGVIVSNPLDQKQTDIDMIFEICNSKKLGLVFINWKSNGFTLFNKTGFTAKTNSKN